MAAATRATTDAKACKSMMRFEGERLVSSPSSWYDVGQKQTDDLPKRCAFYACICSPRCGALWWFLKCGKIGRKNVKISDAADFNSFLKLVLISGNENSHEQAWNAAFILPLIKFSDPCVSRWQCILEVFGPEKTLIQVFFLINLCPEAQFVIQDL